MGRYVAGRCGRYDSVTSATLYRLDENCYSDPTGSHRITLGHSAVITTYSDGTCTNVKSSTTVRQAAMGLGPYGVCIDEITGFYGGSRPNLTAVAIYGDDMCSGTPTQLQLSQDFVQQTHPAKVSTTLAFRLPAAPTTFWGIRRPSSALTLRT